MPPVERIRVQRLRLELDPPFHANWDPVPRTSFEATLVRVTDADGREGVGSGDTLDGFRPHAERFLGSDPSRIEDQVRRLESIDFHGGRPWPFEAALWDLDGRREGWPVWRAMGGLSDRVPAYASTGAARAGDAHAEVVEGLVAQGFRAVKLRLDAADLPGALAEVAAVRDAVGDAVELMVDLNQGWRMAHDTAVSIDPVQARRFADGLAELGVFWLEEPLLNRDLRGLSALRADGRVRIAGGEMTRTFDDALAALDADAYDVHQQDVVLSCGLWRCRTLAELAWRRGRRWTPHTWSNGIGLLANLHVAAGAGGGPFLEFPYDPDGWGTERRDFMLADPVEVDADGMLVCPDAPGLGIELDEDVVAGTLVDEWAVSL